MERPATNLADVAYIELMSEFGDRLCRVPATVDGDALNVELVDRDVARCWSVLLLDRDGAILELVPSRRATEARSVPVAEPVDETPKKTAFFVPGLSDIKPRKPPPGITLDEYVIWHRQERARFMDEVDAAIAKFASEMEDAQIEAMQRKVDGELPH